MKDIKDIKKIDIKEISNMSDQTRNELVEKISALLFQLRLALAAGQLKNTHFINILRKNLARIFTYENNINRAK